MVAETHDLLVFAALIRLVFEISNLVLVKGKEVFDTHRECL